MELVKIVIPLYTTKLNAYEWLSFRHNIALMKRYPIVLLVPEGFDTVRFTTEFPQCEVMTVSDEWLGKKNGRGGYNRMMLSEEFYALFADCSYILICQLDAWIFRDELADWCLRGFDYIGGVWWHNRCRTLPLARRLFSPNDRLYSKVGNGGFSLRRVDAFRKACVALHERAEFYLNQLHHSYAEDVFWALEPTDFRRPSIREANAFAFDGRPRHGFRINRNELPFGCHAWYKRSRIGFWKKHIDIELK